MINKTFRMAYTKTPTTSVKYIAEDVLEKQGKLHKSTKNTVTVALLDYLEDLVNFERGH